MRRLAGICTVRIAQAVGVAWAVATLCFVLLHAIPGDLALRLAAARFGEDRLTVETTERVRREAGLDRPLAWQYADWIGKLARGDLGNSLISQKPVSAEIAYYGRYTLVLGTLGWLLSWIIAVPLGIAAGFRPDRTLDRMM